MTDAQVAKGLAYFSFGLGALEIAAPDFLQRRHGIAGDHSKLLRGCGMREIGAGATILKDPAKGLWARFSGDLMDIGTLFAAIPKSTKKGRIVASLALVAGITALDWIYARRFS
ncbi:MAG: hypothetical protein ACJ790_00110 [Myxococcaceae bacterium]